MSSNFTLSRSSRLLISAAAAADARSVRGHQAHDAQTCKLDSMGLCDCATQRKPRFRKTKPQISSLLACAALRRTVKTAASLSDPASRNTYNALTSGGRKVVFSTEMTKMTLEQRWACACHQLRTSGGPCSRCAAFEMLPHAQHDTTTA